MPVGSHKATAGVHCVVVGCVLVQEYDYKGHDLEQELLHSSIVTLSHLLYTLDAAYLLQTHSSTL